MSSLPLSFDQAEPPSSPPPPFEESNPSTTQHVYNSHDILFDFEPPNEPPPSYSAYVHDRVCRLSSLSTFAYRGSGPLQALDNQPQWFYLKSSLFETNLLYLHKPDDSQPAVSITESEGITPVNATSTSDATVTRSLGNLYSSCRATMRQLVDSQIELIKALTFTSDHYVNQLLDKSVSNRNSTRNLMQLFKLRNDNNITSKPDEIQYRASDGARAILKVYLSPLSTFIKLHKSLLSAIQTVYLADTWTSSTFSQLISEIQEMHIYLKLTREHSVDMVAFENLYFTDKKLRRTINQLEKMAPASRQSLRRMVFVIAIEQFWSIGTTLCDIYTSNKHIFSNDVNESLVACLVILEGIAADLWPLLRKLASQQRLALFQRNVANLKEPLLSLDHPLLYMSFVHYQVTPFKDDHIDGYGILLANELILVSKTNDTEREFTMQFRINWQGMQVQRAKYRNAFVGYGISIQSPYVSGIRIYIGDKSKYVQWRKVLEKLPVRWKSATTIVTSMPSLSGTHYSLDESCVSSAFGPSILIHNTTGSIDSIF